MSSYEAFEDAWNVDLRIATATIGDFGSRLIPPNEANALRT